MSPKVREELEKGMMPFINVLIENQEMMRDNINKISFLKSEISFEVIKKEFDKEFNVIPCTVPIFGKNSGELSILGVHKAMAIGMVPLTTGIAVPWTIPLFFGGMLATNSLMGGLLKIVNFFIVFIIWVPFLKIIDIKNLKDEGTVISE